MAIYMWREVVTPPFTPGDNTLAFFPLTDNQLDVTGNYTLSATGTQQTIGYSFSTTCTFSYSPLVYEKYFSYWVNVSTNTKATLGLSNYGTFRLNWKNGGTNYEKFVFKDASNNFHESQELGLSYNTWYHIAYSISTGGDYAGYINGTSVYSGTSTIVNYTASNIINNTNGAITVSNIIIEKEPRTAQQVSDYYNATKADYGIS